MKKEKYDANSKPSSTTYCLFYFEQHPAYEILASYIPSTQIRNPSRIPAHHRQQTSCPRYIHRASRRPRRLGIHTQDDTRGTKMVRAHRSRSRSFLRAMTSEREREEATALAMGAVNRLDFIIDSRAGWRRGYISLFIRTFGYNGFLDWYILEK